MYTLGINAAYHDSSACLVRDGKPLAAAAWRAQVPRLVLLSFSTSGGNRLALAARARHALAVSDNTVSQCSVRYA